MTERLIGEIIHKSLLQYIFWVDDTKKVQEGKDQEKAQSEKDSHSTNQVGGVIQH